MKIEYFDDFRGENPYAFLSNFYVYPVWMFGREYMTGEHAFQALKSATVVQHEAVRLASTPSKAKKMGRTLPLRPDWEAVKYDVMVQVLRAKFFQGGELATRLLDTGNALLVEGTEWNDRVWGVSLPSKRGRNWLGKLLMSRRAELASGEPDTDDNTALYFIAKIYTPAK